MTSETNNTNPRNGSITAGLTTGIIGTSLGALGILGGGASLLNGLNGGGQQKPSSHDFVSREEFIMNSQLMARDAQIADLKAEMKDEKKMTEVYAVLANKINEVNEKVLSNRDRSDDRLASAVEKLNGKIDFNKSQQDAVNCHQIAYNSTNTAQIACLQGQISQLQGMTKLVIPNSSVCPGWGSVTITPTALSAT